VTVQTFVYPDAGALAEAACDLAVGKIEEALAARGRACLVLAGGSTPRQAYSLLGREIIRRRLPVDRMTWLFGDERWVPVNDAQSNEGMARETLLGPIGAPEESVISWNAGTGDPVDCARRFAGAAHKAAGTPDLLLLGMGADGHTASLFPDGVAHLADGGQARVSSDIPGYAAAVHSAAAGGWRLTLTPGALRASRAVAFLVDGALKAAALSRARSADPSTPAAWIRCPQTIYLVTRNALGPESVEYGRDTRHA